MPHNIVGLMKGIGDRLTDVDDAFLSIVGYSRAEFERGDMNWREMTPPEHVHLDEAGIKQALTAEAGGFTVPYRKEFFRKDGSRVPVLLCCAFIPNAEPGLWMGYVVDLARHTPQRSDASDALASFNTVEPTSLHRRLLGELVRERTQLLAVFDTTTTMMWAVNAQLQLLVANNAFQDQVSLVLHRHLEVGEPVLLDEFPDELLRQWKSLYQRALDGERFVEYTRQRIGLDEEHWDHAFAPIRDDANGVIGVSVVSQNVNKRVRAEARAEEKHRDLLEAQRVAKTGSWEFNASTNAIRWSEEMYRIFGRDPAAGPPSLDALASYYAPEDWTGIYSQVQQAVATGASFAHESVIYRADGLKVWTEGRGEAVKVDGVIVGLRGATLDITTTKTATLALAQREHELREAQRIARMGSWDWNQHADTLTWSSSMAELLGWPHDMAPASFSAQAPLYTEESWTRLQRAVAGALERGEPFQIDLELNPDVVSTVRWVVARVEPVFDGLGEISGLHGVTSDISGRRQAEQESKRLETLLIQSQKMQAIGQLAGGIAHDFNNLLTAVLLQLNSLREESTLTAAVSTGLHEIETEVNRATSLTRQLLLFSRRQAPELRQVELNGLVSGLLSMLRRLIGEHVELEFVGTDAPVYLRADPGMLQQVLMNLIVNARDAMPNGGRISVCAKLLSFGEDASRHRPNARAGKFVELEVGDTGSGIDTVHAAHLFEPFFTTKDPGKGTGLGLATAYGIVALHSGWIEFDSVLGQGSRFRVVLPTSDETVTTSDAVPAPKLPQSESVVRVLLAEDEPGVRKLLVRVLQRNGYVVESAENGREALKIWLAQDGAFDVVVSDMVMPGGMSGLELLAQIEAARPSVRTMLISGYSSSLSDRLFSEPFKGRMLAKPFTADEFVRALGEVLAAS